MYQKSQSYDARFLRYRVRQTLFFVIFGHFLPFTPLTTRKIKIFKKWKKKKKKKKSWDIILLHKCTKNHDHMLYSPWDTVSDGCNFYISFWDIFCPFMPLMAWKIKIFIKWKKTPEDIIILHMFTKIMMTWKEKWKKISEAYLDVPPK